MNTIDYWTCTSLYSTLYSMYIRALTCAKHRQDIEPSSQIRELYGAVHKTRLRTALSLRRGNLQRWTSLPVYYQVVYFTVGTPVYVWSISFSLFLSLSLCLGILRNVSDDPRLLLFIFLALSLFLSFPVMHLPEHTWTTFVLLPCSQWPATAFLLLYLTLPPHSSFWSDIGWFLIFARRALLVPSTWLCETHCAYSCKLRSSNRRIRWNDQRDYLRTLFKWISGCPASLEEYKLPRSTDWEYNSIKKKKKKGKQ